MDKARFLENLTKERKKRSLTQKELAQALGISDKTYSKWETGENEPDIDALCRLAEYYGVGPAAFFREGEDSSPLEGMGAAEAGEACFRRIRELLLGLRSLPYPLVDKPVEMPVPEMPEELRMELTDRSIWQFDNRDLMALTAGGPDANFCMLMLPHGERYRWLETAGEGLEALFRFLSLPGAMKCLYAMLTEEAGSLFTPEYLAEKAGVTVAEAAAVLAGAEPWNLCAGHPFYREDGQGRLYSGSLHVSLLGLLTLGRIFISTDPRWGSRGVICSGQSHVNLPPIEKGETP